MPKPKPFKVPTKPAQAADLLYQLREQRLEINRQAAALEANEKAIKEWLINTLPKGEANGITGKLARVEIVTKDVATVEDRAALQKYISNPKNKAWDLMTAAINQNAVRDRWERGVKVPGVGTFTAITVSCTKR